MAGQTIVQYGNVTLYRCTTQRIEQTPVLDSISGTVLKCWRTVVHVQGYLHGWPSAVLYQEVTGGTAQSALAGSVGRAYQEVRYRLPPRQTFEMAVGCDATIGSGSRVVYGEPFTASEPADLATDGLSNLDVDDGPRCLQFSVVHVSANSVFRVDAVFEVNRVICDDSGGAPDNQTGVLCHRWGCSDALDTNLRATRTYRGLVEIASAQFSPHWFRYLVVPPIQGGFRREHMSFEATPDGKKLAYTVVDQEIAIAAPHPARRWNIEHSETSLKQDGVGKIHGSCTVTLEGDNNVDKTQLIVLGLYVVSAKLLGVAPGADVPPTVMMGDVTIVDFTGDVNAVRISATCHRPADMKVGVALSKPGFVKKILEADLPAFAAGYNPRQSAGGRNGEQPPYQGPAALTGMFRSKLSNPCGSPVGITAAPLTTSDHNENTAATPAATMDAVVLEDIDTESVSYLSTSHKDNCYTHYQCESVFQSHEMRAAMPIARASSSSSGIDTSDATAIIRLAASQSRVILRIVAERVGKWPEFPDPENLYGGNATYSSSETTPPNIAAVGMELLRSKLLGGTVTKTATGENLYRSRLEARFACKRKPNKAELLILGQNPWTNESQTFSTTDLTNGW